MRTPSHTKKKQNLLRFPRIFLTKKIWKKKIPLVICPTEETLKIFFSQQWTEHPKRPLAVSLPHRISHVTKGLFHFYVFALLTYCTLYGKPRVFANNWEETPFSCKMTPFSFLPWCETGVCAIRVSGPLDACNGGGGSITQKKKKRGEGETFCNIWEMGGGGGGTTTSHRTADKGCAKKQRRSSDNASSAAD